MGYKAALRVRRGDAGAGELAGYQVEVNEGEVVFDVLHRLQATQANDLAELEMHPADTADRREIAQDDFGLGFCNITKCCTEVCPENIKITDNALIPMKERVALAGYTGGVVAGAAFAGTPELGQPVWPIQVTRTLAVESGVLAAFTGEWLAALWSPRWAAAAVLIPIAVVLTGSLATTRRRPSP